MTEMELVKMSQKGQLVVPKEIRDIEDFKPSDRFVPFHVKGGILFKRMKIPNVKAEFASLAKEIEKQFKNEKIATKDVDGAVKWARTR